MSKRNCKKDEVYLMHSFTVEYMDFNAFTYLLLTLSTNSFCHE